MAASDVFTGLKTDSDQAEKSVVTGAAVMVNAATIFTIAGGPVLIKQLVSECVTVNDATASTLQWSATPTGLSAQTFSAATASLGAAAVGTLVVLNFTSLATAPDIRTGGVALAGVVSATNKGFLLLPGIITTVIGVGSTTGTWRHYVRFIPMRPSSRIIPTLPG
jgi:hypothetical protein